MNRDLKPGNARGVRYSPEAKPGFDLIAGFALLVQGSRTILQDSRPCGAGSSKLHLGPEEFAPSLCETTSVAQALLPVVLKSSLCNRSRSNLRLRQWLA